MRFNAILCVFTAVLISSMAGHQGFSQGQDAGTQVLLQEMNQPAGDAGAAAAVPGDAEKKPEVTACLLYTSPSPRDRQKSRMPSSA